MEKVTSRPLATSLNDNCLIHVVEDPAGNPLNVKMTIAQLKTELDLYTKAEVEFETRKWALILGD